MICKSERSPHNEYAYRFVDNGEVELSNENETFRISYEDWSLDYYIIDKFRKEPNNGKQDGQN